MPPPHDPRELQAWMRSVLGGALNRSPWMSVIFISCPSGLPTRCLDPEVVAEVAWSDNRAAGRVVGGGRFSLPGALLRPSGRLFRTGSPASGKEIAGASGERAGLAASSSWTGGDGCCWRGLGTLPKKFSLVCLNLSPLGGAAPEDDFLKPSRVRLDDIFSPPSFLLFSLRRWFCS